METFQQPKITGYRQLTEEEVALMNEAKALAEQCGALIEKLRNKYPTTYPDSAPGLVDVGDGRFAPTLDKRWISIGATDLQRGFMAVIRGIAQPTTF